MRRYPCSAKVDRVDENLDIVSTPDRHSPSDNCERDDRALEVKSMNPTPEVTHNARSLASILAELKDEAKEFAETRIAIFKAEMREKLAHLKVAIPLAVIGLLLLFTSYLLITAAIVALVAVFVPTAFRWAIAFGGVGILWGILGGLAAYIAKKEFEINRMAPQKTLEVLKGDKTWLEHEMRKQYEHSAARNVAA
jgi:uncharacterized membrane protein YqjE